MWVHGDPNGGSDQATGATSAEVPVISAHAAGGGLAVIVGEGLTPGGPSDQGGAPAGGPNPGGAPSGVPNQGITQGDRLDPDGAPRTRERNGGQGENTGPTRVPGPTLHGSAPGRLVDRDSSSPQAVEGVLAESLPIDLTALDRAIDECLGQIDAMGENLAEMLEGDGAWPWLAGAVVASAAGAMAHWWGRRSRYRPFAVVNGEGTLSSWFLESISRE